MRSRQAGHQFVAPSDPLDPIVARCRAAPDAPHLWVQLLDVALSLGNLRVARAASDHLRDLAVSDWRIELKRAMLLALMGQRRPALDQVAHALDLAQSLFDDHATLGLIYSYCNEAALAEPAFRQALTENPASPTLCYNLAVTLRMTGKFPEALALCATLLRARPDHVDALSLQSELRRQTEDDNHVATLQAQLDGGDLSHRDQIRLRFALAKELEDLKQADAALEQVNLGCELQRRVIAYTVEDDLETLDLIRRSHDARGLASMANGRTTAAPIFLVGLPRTGTTLLERMLTMHSSIGTVGETNAFALELMAEAGRKGRRLDKKTLVEESLTLSPDSLADAYQHAVGADLHPGRRLIDKMPLNYLYLGLIARAMPQATLVFMDRSPMDSIFAMYKSLFANAYPFSYQLEELARYYVHWRALMTHWRDTLGDRLLIVRYEDLISRPEPVLRKALAHCRLAFDERCLNFTRNPIASQTLSAVQVRQPLHRESIGRWRQHAVHLQPAVAILTEAGIPLEWG
ncbi:tetratricopeptide repeat-containing sulfotransferase family protein [Sphingomonas sp. 2378]|uniref:tetratricopeptide repeat-containing sulfotransferase family protein n=1 Tax=Sphingomonas sp. 2378 TaxID=1219748 RepID=UPI00311B394F